MAETPHLLCQEECEDSTGGPFREQDDSWDLGTLKEGGMAGFRE